MTQTQPAWRSLVANLREFAGRDGTLSSDMGLLIEAASTIETYAQGMEILGLEPPHSTALIEAEADVFWKQEQPAPDERPGRQFVRATGWKEHSGVTWHREHIDIAYTDNAGPFGYRAEDIERIRRDGDMDAVEHITHWMQATFPEITP